MFVCVMNCVVMLVVYCRFVLFIVMCEMAWYLIVSVVWLVLGK